jgi:hypothetical protein
VPEYSFTVWEHDLDKPWVVVSQEHRTVTLDDGMSFSAWAAEQWPEPRWKVELDPWQDSPAWVGSGAPRR